MNSDLETRIVNFALNALHLQIVDLYNTNAIPDNKTTDQKELITIMAMLAKAYLKPLPESATDQEKLQNLLHSHILDLTISSQSIPDLPGSDSKLLISHLLERSLLQKIESWGQA